MPVPLFASSLDRYKPLLTERMAEVVRDGRYILGPEVEAFEQEFAAYLGVRHCVGVASVLRRGPRDVLRHGRDGAGGTDPAHQGGDRRAPVRQRGPGPRDPRA